MAVWGVRLGGTVEYQKRDPRWRRTRLARAAGWAGRLVYEHLLQVAGDFDLRGRFPAVEQDYEWLAAEWMTSPARDAQELLELLAIPLTELLRRGVEALTRVGLIVTEPDGAWVLPEWEALYGPRAKTSTERSREHRARQQAATHATLQRPGDTGNARDDSNATSPTSPTSPTYVVLASEPPSGPTGGEKDFKLEVQDEKTPKPASRQIQFWRNARALRAKLLPTEAPDEEWTAGRITKDLTAVVDALGVVGASRAYEQFCAAPTYKRLTPAYPMWAFVKDYPRFVQAAPDSPSMPRAPRVVEDPHAPKPIRPRSGT